MAVAYRRVLALIATPLAAATLVAVATSSAAAPGRLDGFTAASSAAERSAEQTFMTYPSATLARSLDKQLSAKPGLVGTANDKQRMQEIVARLKLVRTEPARNTYYVYMSVPKSISVQMTAPVSFTAANKEKCRREEPDCAGEVVGYNALSPSGD